MSTIKHNVISLEYLKTLKLKRRPYATEALERESGLTQTKSNYRN